MVSDQEFASCVESVLCGFAGGPKEASLAAVLQQAEAKLGTDLSHKAQFIRDQMDLFFGPSLQPQPQSKSQAALPPPQAIPTAASVPQPDAQVLQQAQAPPLAQQIRTQPQQHQQLAALQPQLIFQAMPQLPATIPAVSSPPAVPAMAFYPPPPLAFRYTTGLGGAATGGTVSFQQPAPGVGGTALPTAAPQVAGDNKER